MTSPTARALLALEAIQDSPGITAQRLGDRLGVTERAARRYVAILREADLPIESLTGPLGGYRVGRSLRLPPLMFTAAEAMGMVMAVLEGHRDAADPSDVVGRALAKIIRVLPTRIAEPVRAFREITPPVGGDVRPDAATVARLVEACDTARRLRLAYWTGTMDVDPWAVVLRHSRWYLLCWSHKKQARRVLRVDRISSVETLADSFTPPAGLDALRTLEDHLSQGWTHAVDVVLDAPIADATRWLSRSLGRVEAISERQSRLVATTDNPEWYARQLAALPLSFQVIGSAELKAAVVALGERLIGS
ncbi:helix-turn-helix transcriptional regulator [Fodinicola acaciae]|uniref:helix-turn-helix transcriptional regulator n=1 Tax=Fodinicola acaciae TaxID=2681555 RepID=UPI001C9E8F22|nr:WYL domain-containing protein [Fodinicola acaciae]